MKKTLLFIFLLTTCLAVSQTPDVLRGKIIADTTQIEAVNIFNRSQGIGTVNDQAGFFEIKAVVGDTILFSSVRHQQKVVVVTKKALRSAMSQVKLEIKVNELEEVRISQYNLSGEAEKDVQSIRTYEDNLPLFNAAQLDETPYIKEMGVKTIKNQVVFDEMSRTPVNFIGIFNMVSSIFKKKKAKSSKREKIPEISSFYNEGFLVEELKVPKERLYDFFEFLNANHKTKEVLGSGNDLKILEFVMKQSEIFNQQKL